MLSSHKTANPQEKKIVVNFRLYESKIKMLEKGESILVYFRGVPFELKKVNF